VLKGFRTHDDHANGLGAKGDSMIINELRSSFARYVMVAALAVAVLLPAAAQAAVLAGQSVDVNSRFEDTLGNIGNGAVYSAIAPGSSATGTGLTAIYTDQQITLTNLTPSSSLIFLTTDFFSGVPFVFNGIHFEVGTPTFTSIAFDPSTNVSGAGAYFNSLNIWVNLAGVTFNTGDKVVLNLNGYTPGVPEPASWALLLIGFGGVGAAMRHNRRQPQREAA
jgi:hypothetical protein